MADINDAKRDGNYVTSMLFKGNDSLTYPVKGDEITGRLLVDSAGGGTVTSITGGTGLTATPNPIVGAGTIALDAKLAPLDTLGTAGQSIRVNAGATALEYYTPAASGLTVGTTTIASGTTTRILYDNAGVLGEYVISGSGNVAMTTSPVFTTPNIGSATGSISGNAGTATALQNARTIGGVSFDGTANITVASATGGFTVSGGNLALGTNSLTLTGSIAATGARVTKGWFTDIESTNAPTVSGAAVYYAGGTDVVVADGGTGVSSLTAYAPIFGGTTGTGAVQSGTVGTAGQVLTSNGAGALPTFQSAPVAENTSGVGNSATSSTTQTITHNLGRTPKIIRIYGLPGFQVAGSSATPTLFSIMALEMMSATSSSRLSVIASRLMSSSFTSRLSLDSLSSVSFMPSSSRSTISRESVPRFSSL